MTKKKSFIWSTTALLFYRQIWYSHILKFTNLVLRYYFLNTLSGANTVKWYIIEQTLFKERRLISFFPLALDSWLSLKVYLQFIVAVRWQKTVLLVRIFTDNTFEPSIFMTSVHPPPPHASRPCVVMWQYTGSFVDPTSSKYAVFPLDLVRQTCHQNS